MLAIAFKTVFSAGDRGAMIFGYIKLRRNRRQHDQEQAHDQEEV